MKGLQWKEVATRALKTKALKRDLNYRFEVLFGPLGGRTGEREAPKTALRANDRVEAFSRNCAHARSMFCRCGKRATCCKQIIFQ